MDNIHAVSSFAEDTAAEMLSILRAEKAVRMIREAGKDGNFVPGLHPMPRELRHTRRWSAHLGRKVLRDVKDIQDRPQ